LTRRFDIGPFVMAFGALVLLVSLFLPWYSFIGPVEENVIVANAGHHNAWQIFEITDLLLAALAIAAFIGAIGLISATVDYVDRRFIPWIVGAALVLVANQILQPPIGIGTGDLGTGAWLAFAASIVMVIGAVLSLTKVSFAVAVEGRDRRRRVAAVDHRPPPTETGAPVARSSTSLLHPDPPEAGEQS
jgi:hypothetical protein